jgi:hypothetical protein
MCGDVDFDLKYRHCHCCCGIISAYQGLCRAGKGERIGIDTRRAGFRFVANDLLILVLCGNTFITALVT